MRGRFVFFAVLLLSGAAHAAESSIVGDWYEDETYDGHRNQALAHFHADGSFTVQFRECYKTGALDRVDTGHYAYSGGMLRMTTETHDGFWVYVIDDYKTLSNDGRKWIYKSVAGLGFQQYGSITFHDIRVTPDSKMPACDLTS